MRPDRHGSGDTGALQSPNRSHLDPDILAKMQSNNPGNRYALHYLGLPYNSTYPQDYMRHPDEVVAKPECAI